MTGIDPAALLECNDGSHELVEVVLVEVDGGWRITIEHEDERVDQVTLRADFLDAVIARARAREAAA